jgi:hypothetical protein
VIAFARSLGHAQVDRRRRQADSRFQDGRPPEKLKPISQAQLVELLGSPRSLSESGRDRISHYEFKLKPSAPGASPAPVIHVRCLCAKSTGHLTRIEITYSRMRVTVDFDASVPAASKPAGTSK